MTRVRIIGLGIAGAMLVIMLAAWFLFFRGDGGQPAAQALPTMEVVGLTQPVTTTVEGRQVVLVPAPTPEAPAQPEPPAAPTAPAPAKAPPPPAAPKAPAAPPAQAAPPPAPAPAANGCSKSGTLAWQNDNQLNGALYGESPVGGLSETCWVVAQTWTDRPSTERWVFAVRPGTVAWLSGHRGGTGWYFGGNDADVSANLARQAAELEARDGKMTTTIVILPDQRFRLVTKTAPSAAAPTPAPQAAPSGATCSGPAILEYGPPATVVKLSVGQTAPTNQGGCFAFPSQAELNARWPAHKADFLGKNPGGSAIER